MSPGLENLMWGLFPPATKLQVLGNEAQMGLVLGLTLVLPLTKVCLSVGEERASTRSFGQILSIRSCSIWRG
jgi:hypothetical protein